MDIKNFNPYVRFCSAVNLSYAYPKLLNAYDYRLFYVLSGGFCAVFEDREISVKEGGMLIFPPATAYKLIPGECGKSNHIIVNFDFVSQNYGTPTKTLAGNESFNREEIYSDECVLPFDKIIHIDDAYFCADALREMCDEKRMQKNGHIEVLSGMFKVLLVRIAREYEKRSKTVLDSGDRLCKKIKEYVKISFSGKISNEIIAHHFGYHPYYVNSLFKRKTGQTLHSYILFCRLSYAKELLVSSEMSVSEIGAECGFCSASYFSEVFLKSTGVTPRDFRQSAR